MPFDLWFELFGNDIIKTAREEHTPDCLIDDYIESSYLEAIEPEEGELDYRDIHHN